MEIGKIRPELLNELVFKPIKENKVRRDEVLVRPEIGEDCSAVDLNGEICLLSTDPITGATEDIGYLAVHINANDIAASGGEPIGVMVTVLLPKYSTEHDLKKIMDGVYRAALEINIEVLGGHTEVTDSVVRPIVSATIIGKTKCFIKTGGAKVGQEVIMTKWAGLEGTSIIAADCREKVLSLGDATLQKALSLSKFLSVIPEANIAKKYGATAMHDITEGGVLGACYELAEASSVGINIYLDKVSILAETKDICELFDVNPYKLISSGCLLITSHNSSLIVSALKEAGIESSVIGEITESEKKYFIGEDAYILGEPSSDEIYKVPINKF